MAPRLEQNQETSGPARKVPADLSLPHSLILGIHYLSGCFRYKTPTPPQPLVPQPQDLCTCCCLFFLEQFTAPLYGCLPVPEPALAEQPGGLCLIAALHTTMTSDHHACTQAPLNEHFLHSTE